MTIPIEEYWSLKRTHQLLRKIAWMNLTEIRKNAKELRKEVFSCLKHYPFDVNLREMYKKRVDDRDLHYLEYKDEQTETSSQDINDSFTKQEQVDCVSDIPNQINGLQKGLVNIGLNHNQILDSAETEYLLNKKCDELKARVQELEEELNGTENMPYSLLNKIYEDVQKDRNHLAKLCKDTVVKYELMHLLQENDKGSYPRDMFESHLDVLLETIGHKVNAQFYEETIMKKARKLKQEIGE